MAGRPTRRRKRGAGGATRPERGPTFSAVRFDVEASAADAWSDGLLAAGALSVEVVDPRAGTSGEAAIFDEHPAGIPQWWPVSRLTALFAQGEDARGTVRRTAGLLKQALPAYDAFEVADRDWVTATQAQFAPIRIAEDFWIVPSWCEPPRRDACIVTLDPGVAFGTGSHPTTGLCLAWLHAHVTRDSSVLDYGCGSGILAIAAAKLGAARTIGTDIDPQAVDAANRNAMQNGVGTIFERVDALPAGTFDLVVANILANPLRVLAPVLAARVADGGRIALSGILDTQVHDVIAAYEDAFAIEPWRTAEGWVLLAGIRREER